MSQYTLPLFCKTIEAHKVTIVYLVPPVALELAQSTLPSQGGINLSSIRFMTSGAAPLSPAIVQALLARHGIKILEGYGLSETSPGVFLMDGYFRTGDIGVFVKVPRVGTCIRVTDRLKELIKYKGFQVAPAKLEGVLLRHEGVADVCVVGVQDQQQALATEVPRAYVVKAPGWKEGEEERVVAADEIRRWSDKKLANHKKLRGGVVFVDSLPRTPSGKLLRRVLRDTNFGGKAKL
ncbi:phenylacetyl- protein [Apiospora aurea]|uniref:Phenylacetyl- protein n=1 Tax=Apiospora aurea TaxID=335848 RepID=A0ABR1QDQ4_9PEZI